MNIFLSFFIFFLSSAQTNSSETIGNLVLDIKNIRNNEGVIQVLLFVDREGFPDNPELALKKISLQIKNHSAQYTLTKMPYGQYALAAIHDENLNMKHDYNFIGYPKEGFAISNNPKIKWRKPHFEEAIFTLQNPEKKIIIEMIYFP